MNPNRPASDSPHPEASQSHRAAGGAGGSANQDIFDVRRVRRLAELMNEHKLVQIDLRQGGNCIRIRREAEPPAAPAQHRPPPAAAEPAAARDIAKPAAPAEPVDEHLKMIRSPMVGTFYAAPDPESHAYVKVGDMVDRETTVCIVEAMKVFNEIPAEVAGKIVAVLVENGEPVEYGQPLFKVDTRQ
jgi:acetyl-CoA carboxylase biotin carboxyl carrier protein